MPPTTKKAPVCTAVLVAASLAVAACGSSGSGSPTILNTEKVERAIEHSSLVQRGKHAQVTCPAGVHQKNGLVFSCTAVVGRTSTRFVVTELDGTGHVHYEAR
jgi:ABC-type polar amino acid transport system ATPase subunit